MFEKSAAAVQAVQSRPPVKAGRAESLSAQVNRLHDLISRRAYELFEKEGRVDGNDLRHWTEAEQELLQPVPVQIGQSDSEIVVTAEVPGFSATDLEVSVEPRRLTISGRHETRKESKENGTISVEETSRDIFRTLELPSEVNAAKVAATLKEGILNVTLPKVNDKKLTGASQLTA